MEPAMQDYTYDVLVVESEMPPPEEDTPPDYVYCVRLYKDFVELPLDRMFAKKFPNEPLGQLTASPCELIDSLSSQGMCIMLRRNEETLGAGSGILPPYMLRQLSDPNFSVTHSIKVELLQRNKHVDLVELKIKLESKHPDFENRFPDFGCYDVCKPLEKSINPQDSIFTLGRSNKCPAHTCITDQRLMSHVGAPFDCVHAAVAPELGDCQCGLRGVQPLSQDPSPQKQRLELQRLLQELNVDALTKPVVCRLPTPPKPASESFEWPSSTDSSSDDERGQGNYCYDADAEDRACVEQRARQRRRRDCLQVEPPVLCETKIVKPDYCQMCGADNSWLPAKSACPDCGYRAMAEFMEERYNEHISANQLLQQRMYKPVLKQDSQEQLLKYREAKTSETSAQRCGCQAEQMCARCRIRKLSHKMFKEDNKPQSVFAPLQEQAKPEPMLEQKPSSTSQRRAQLVKIFTEMRNAYEPSGKKCKEDSLADNLSKELNEQCKKATSSPAQRRTRKFLKRVVKEIDQMYPSKKKRKLPKPRPLSKRYYFLEKRQNNRYQHIRHDNCIKDTIPTKVPCHMGWWWTKADLARHKSWKPGAITKPIRQLMSYFLKDFPVDTICLSRYHVVSKPAPKTPEQPLVQHTMLHICKKKNEYIVTFRPLKDAVTLALSADPFADMKPVVVHIIKDPELAEKRHLKRELQKLGFPPCRCQQTVQQCCCRSWIDKKIVVTELENMCQQDGWPGLSDTFVYSEPSDSDSEAEYDFGVTPPAAIIKPERLKESHLINAETQYDENDWAVPTMYPHPPNAFVQYCGCTAGERKNFFKWIYGKGNVHAEPKSPKMRNIKKRKRKLLPKTSK